MNKLHLKKKYVLFLLIGIIIVCITVFICIKTISKKYGDNYFIQYSSYAAVPQKSNYKLDLGYFIQRGNRDILNEKRIINVSFANSNLTKVNSFTILNGSTTSKYDIKTLSLDVSFPSTGIEYVDHIQITFIDGTKKIYPIGEWKFDVSNMDEGNFIETSSYFPIVSNNLNNYFMKFKNNTAKTLTINNLILNYPGISTNFEKFFVGENEEVDKSLILKVNSQNNFTHNVYFFKPRIEYVLNNKVYSYYPPGTYYGIINLDEEAIDQEISKSRLNK